VLAGIVGAVVAGMVLPATARAAGRRSVALEVDALDALSGLQ
jgi:hypothetical protein